MKDKIRPVHHIITNYWLAYYSTEHCTLCGNKGIIDTTGVTTYMGLPVGRRNYCICSNGQHMRKEGTAIK